MFSAKEINHLLVGKKSITQISWERFLKLIALDFLVFFFFLISELISLLFPMFSSKRCFKKPCHLFPTNNQKIFFSLSSFSFFYKIMENERIVP